ncbi:hypothetical protein NMY22_g6796 [Coprinellus aureogranulatus]|nr:hypothetical protein NMY22_g6796 [Coprinellus aureogranulatus]
MLGTLGPRFDHCTLHRVLLTKRRDHFDKKRLVLALALRSLVQPLGAGPEQKPRDEAPFGDGITPSPPLALLNAYLCPGDHGWFAHKEFAV